jgi:carbonic anhydrase
MPMKTAQRALDELLAGNLRFAAGQPQSRPNIDRIRPLAAGQAPFATVLACADSRVPVETLFDHDPGDIFVVRLAGNFMSEAALASIEYAVEVLHCPLVMVLGHTQCGAVRAAVDFVQSGKTFPGHIQLFAEAIAPAARVAKNAAGDWWHNAVIENARYYAERLRNAEPILQQAAAEKRAMIVGAVYDLATGKVTLV